MMSSLLSLQNVSIRFGSKLAVDRFDLDIRHGERLALVGESGSGKTVTGLSILRLLGHARTSGKILFEGRDLLRASEDEIHRVRGADVAMIFQEPMSALNPLYTIGSQIVETLVLHEGLSSRAAHEKTIHLLARTGIREPEQRIDAYPHQLSGGQRQRAMIAMALACRPKLLIADEPTTALDMTIRSRIVRLLLELQQAEADEGRGMAILLITHDLHLVRRFAQRVAVMERGRLVETADTETLFSAPRHPYTIKLLDSIPRRQAPPVEGDAPILVETRGLRVEYAKPKRRSSVLDWLRTERFAAVVGADLSLRRGETIGVVGESGSGKSTLAQAILGLVPTKSGELDFEGAPVAAKSRREKRALHAKLQVVFQDPFGALSPRLTVEQIVGEGLSLHFPELGEAERRKRTIEVLADVGLPASSLGCYPHEFSGGQRQRIAIARALVLSPRVLVLDEPTSALDVSVQNQVLELLARLQQKYGLSYVLITHDLAVANALAHRLYVMKDGEIVETGETRSLLSAPRHPYTQSLVQASL
ncbi:MAG: microcin ABC transporter ATP-binding protein [Methylocystaceae bacterium]|nr:MAG: microcin ABC transporter ATP-binding protein [Methylocystaceae bacterium]